MRIFYFCPSLDEPIGGVKVIYQHVDCLNRRGMDAYVLHDTEGFRATWFSNQTKIAYATEGAEYDIGDYLVIPDYESHRLYRAMPGTKKVIFQQGPSFAFGTGDPQGFKIRRRPFADPNVKASLVVSEYLATYIKHAFPGKPVFRTRLRIDTDVFSLPAKGQSKKKQIAVMPRRNFEEASLVLKMLASRDALGEFSIVLIDKMKQHEVAKTLRDSWIFLSLSPLEGFGLPLAEAMASGCLVVGYHGFGGKEFLLPNASYPVETGNLLACAKTLEKVINKIEQNPRAAERASTRARRLIQGRYGGSQSEDSIVAAWKHIFRL